MIRRLYPHPWLSLTLVLVWMLLVNRWAVSGLCGHRGDRGAADDRALLARGARLQPSGQDPRLCRHCRLGHHQGEFRRGADRAVHAAPRPAPAWIVIPLELRRPEAITRWRPPSP